MWGFMILGIPYSGLRKAILLIGFILGSPICVKPHVAVGLVQQLGQHRLQDTPKADLTKSRIVRSWLLRDFNPVKL